MTETTQLSSSINLCCKVEALLFVASEALSVAQLSELCGAKQADVIETLNELRALYENRGLKLQEFNNRYQITTTPEVSEIIEKMFGLEATAKLSKAALECLAVVAYRQPVTRPGIDAIRGVNSDGVLKSLLSKGLIEEVGRAETPGRPILYGVTDLFLQHFGLDMLSALPPFEVEETVETSGSNGILKD
jgi:segregation and condensation protein B